MLLSFSLYSGSRVILRANTLPPSLEVLGGLGIMSL